jgi:hypothetical protein
MSNSSLNIPAAPAEDHRLGFDVFAGIFEELSRAKIRRCELRACFDEVANAHGEVSFRDFVEWLMPGRDEEHTRRKIFDAWSLTERALRGIPAAPQEHSTSTDPRAAGSTSATVPVVPRVPVAAPKVWPRPPTMPIDAAARRRNIAQAEARVPQPDQFTQESHFISQAMQETEDTDRNHPDDAAGVKVIRDLGGRGILTFVEKELVSTINEALESEDLLAMGATRRQSLESGDKAVVARLAQRLQSLSLHTKIAQAMVDYTQQYVEPEGDNAQSDVKSSQEAWEEFWLRLFPGQGRPIPQSCLASQQLYAEVRSWLGGRQHIEAFAGSSERIQQAITSRNDPNESSHCRHDPIYYSSGLDGLLSAAVSIEPTFQSLVQCIADDFSARAVFGPMKSKAQALSKVIVRYGGNHSRLTDIVRGSLLFDGAKEAVQSMYECLEYIVTLDKFQGQRISIKRFKDRFQKSLNGYMDLQLLVKINGFVCELQINSCTMSVAKESRWGHCDYGRRRKLNHDVVCAAMHNDLAALQLALNKGANPDFSNTHGLASLHFCARHGSADMVEQLLRKGADLFAVDDCMMIPLSHAVLGSQHKVIDILLAEMKKHDNIEFRKHGFSHDGRQVIAKVAALALEHPCPFSGLSVDKEVQVVQYASHAYQQICGDDCIWNEWLELGCNEAFLRALDLWEGGKLDKMMVPRRHSQGNHISTVDLANSRCMTRVVERLCSLGYTPTPSDIGR